MKRNLSGNEVRYILRSERINLRQLADKLGISPQTLNSRLNAGEVKTSFLEDINHALGQELFHSDMPVPQWTGRQPIILVLPFGNNFRTKVSFINRSIKETAKNVDIKRRVSPYTARKSFVQHGFDIGINLETLEYCIGQSVKRNRPIFNYVRIMQRHADEAIRKIIDNLNGEMYPKSTPKTTLKVP